MQPAQRVCLSAQFSTHFVDHIQSETEAEGTSRISGQQINSSRKTSRLRFGFSASIEDYLHAISDTAIVCCVVVSAAAVQERRGGGGSGGRRTLPATAEVSASDAACFEERLRRASAAVRLRSQTNQRASETGFPGLPLVADGRTTTPRPLVACLPAPAPPVRLCDVPV